ncbi:hypothetical protein CANCADRAFT_1989 [Tortispora caseinolytica NRRL Y-17796]|uniref:Prefoldin subunit 3 n=1 Tax=Tortispora caseinolytica NRRL Y-17796 TaxID=767744 RepID=A0A1E4TF12_9ASCO|nr:hypothetical protein CANCADRAFT_1989 [Tortispora caseinolytica NRRL Y-17796]
MASNDEIVQLAKRAAEKLRINDTETNPRGIPKAPFIDQVEKFVANADEAEAMLRMLQSMLDKYQSMEAVTLQKKASLNQRVPDIKETLQTVEFLKEQAAKSKSTVTTYELDETMHAHAQIDPTDAVCLWLGANVMLEYPIDEAVELLTERLDAANKNLKDCDEDLEFLREAITTIQVNTARVYNWDIQRRKAEKSRPEHEVVT